MQYNQLASNESIQTTIGELAKHNVEAIVVDTKKGALEKIKQLIPAGVSVMNGTSTTLVEIGFVDYLKEGKHGWNNLHETILAEKDPAKQGQLRKESALSDYYLGSVHALSQTGEFVIASNTGSQLPHIVFTSQNLLFIVGAQKIVPTLSEALKRLEEYVVPLEDERSKQAYGAPTTLNKIVIFKGESPMIGRKVKMIIVKESLGF
ncbi:lactate utilization protein [Candidatus Woesebacteria bacterium]|nr:lactate utilization protein [Candidatus Woesebacteria bacterium]